MASSEDYKHLLLPISIIEMSFSKKILQWYSDNRRSLPWRNTKDPYKIWLSEIILQQTRVAQGLPFYENILVHFPTVQDLAAATEEDILKLWQGLGYYSRARNLHATAKRVAREFNGKFPENYEGLLQLKGIGDYTASAIASSSFNLSEPVVDGNVYRVLARYFGVALATNSTRGIRYFKELAREVMATDNARDYNQGIMEFGALQCTPQKPNCGQCPLNDSCVALKENRIDELPLKMKKGTIKKRFFNYMIILDPDNKTQLQKRMGKGIWQNLFEFPLLETEGEAGHDQIKKALVEILDADKVQDLEQTSSGEIVHRLSHQHLHTKFWLVKTNQKIEEGIAIGELENYPVPILIADAIKTLKISYF